MSLLPNNIEYKIKALPTEGLEEYAFWMERYVKISSSNVEILRILKRLKEIDLENDYTDRIDRQLVTAILDDMAWEIESRRLFAKWLRNR